MQMTLPASLRTGCPGISRRPWNECSQNPRDCGAVVQSCRKLTTFSMTMTWSTSGQHKKMIEGVCPPVYKQMHVVLDDLRTCPQAQIHRPHLESRRSPHICCAVDNFETNFCQTALVSCRNLVATITRLRKEKWGRSIPSDENCHGSREESRRAPGRNL